METAAGQEWDVIKENALIVLNLGLLYLDFVDAYCDGFNARVEKCVQCFAIIFQDLALKNYAGETMHTVACLKKIWKSKFRYVSAYKYFADLVLIARYAGIARMFSD